MSKEEFLEKVENNEELYNQIQNSKSGYITIEKDHDIHRGYTAMFGEGLPCYLSSVSEWYITSNVQKIDWENKTFDTLNSTYKFKFQER